MYFKKETDYLMRIVVCLAREYSKGTEYLYLKTVCRETGLLKTKAQRLCSWLETNGFCSCEKMGRLSKDVIKVLPSLQEANVNDILKISSDDINAFMLFDKGNKQWENNAGLFRKMENEMKKICASVKIKDIINYEKAFR